MLKIHGVETSSNVQKVLWCCDELGLAFERIDTRGRNRTPEYLALNPNGLVPTIDDDGFVLWESNAIVRYLCGLHGMGTLCPADPRRRADADRWMDWQQTTLAGPMGVLFRAWLRTPRDEIAPALRDEALGKATASWTILDARLADRAFVAGDALTMADIVLGNAIHRWNRLPVERAELRNLAAWYARLRERPAYRERIAAF